MWFIVLAIILAFLIYFIGIKPLKYWEERGVPSLKAWPFVGNFGATFTGKRAQMLIVEDTYKAFPERRYVGFFNFITPTLMLRDTELIKIISVKEFQTFPEHRQFIPENIDPLWSKNLFAMRGGEKWQDIRSTLSPAFTSSKMRMMFELMRDCSKQFSDHFQKQGDMVTVEMKDVFTRFANDVIATTAFGVTCDSLKNRDNEFYLMGKDATTFTGIKGLTFLVHVMTPLLGKLLRIPIFSKAVSKFFRDLIKETIKVREDQGIIRPDMIHLLMEARRGRLKQEEQTSEMVDSGFAVVQESELGKAQKRQKTKITDEDITALALGFFFAGFDTVSTMLCHATYELALNPDIQERLRREVDEALEKCNGEITYETLLGMKYLDMVVTETLRKWPPFGLNDRVATRPFTIEPKLPNEKPLHLSAGTICFIPIYAIQRDPKYYPNPEKFDPERFNHENKHNIDPFAYLPFGVGPRNCIGSRFALLESKLVLTEIISKFEIVPVEKTPIPIVYSPSNFAPVPDEGFWLGLKTRIASH